MRGPEVLLAVSPTYAINFFLRNHMHGFVVLAAVFLVVTGGEALYADMGHFGRRPIRLSWFIVVLPALLLNYFGQGSLLLQNATTVHNPFFRLAPTWALYPLVVLATAAAVIASQAVISGAFSLTMQAVQLGYLPRVEIDHTSARERGQIYVPPVNWILMLACIGLVLGFRSSSNLAAAYGVAVTTTMVITTVLLYVVGRQRWHWRTARALPITLGFLALDVSFFGANVIKIPHGGWFALAVAGFIYLLMTTWKRGRAILAQRLRDASTPLEDVLAGLSRDGPHRVRGTAVFMTGHSQGTPPALLHNLKHNQVLHEQVVLLTIVTEDIPHVALSDRFTVQELGQGFFRVVAHYGFMEEPDVPQLFQLARERGLKTELMRTTFFLGRERIISRKRRGLGRLRDNLFAVMSQNAQGATSFFRIPPNRVVELGAQIEI